MREKVLGKLVDSELSTCFLSIWYNTLTKAEKEDLMDSMIVVMCAACGFAALLAIQAVNMRKRRQSEERVMKGYFLLGLSGLMAKIAQADGQVTEDEVALAEGFFRKMALTDAERAMVVGNFVTARRDGLNARDHARRFIAYANPTACEFLYDLLWRISRADGVVAEAEMGLLKEIALYLGLGEPTFDRFKAGGSTVYDRASLKACGVPESLLTLA